MELDLMIHSNHQLEHILIEILYFNVLIIIILVESVKSVYV